MNAREAMKLLLEGKTLERDNPRFLMKLDENGTLVSCDSKNLKYGLYAFSDCHTMIGEFDRVYEEGEHKPCPFCGSTRIKERYLDDDCEEIEEWMVEEANSYANEDGSEPYNSIDEYREVNAFYWQVYCPRCDVYVTSAKSMEDAWAKWDRRAKE